MTSKNSTTTETGTVDLDEQELRDIDLPQIRGGHASYKMSDVTISNAKNKGPKPGSQGSVRDFSFGVERE